MPGDLPVALFIGSKGGSGTTTLCTELSRAMKAKRNVALVDADLTGRRSIAVILEAVRSLDAGRTNAAISSVRVDGVTVVELVDRYDAVFTLGEAVENFAAGMTG